MNQLAKSLFKLMVNNSKRVVPKVAGINPLMSHAPLALSFPNQMTNKTRMNFFKQKDDAKEKEKPEEQTKQEEKQQEQKEQKANTDQQTTNPETSQKETETAQNKQKQVQNQAELPNQIDQLLAINSEEARLKITKQFKQLESDLEDAKQQNQEQTQKVNIFRMLLTKLKRLIFYQQIKQSEHNQEDTRQKLTDLRDNLKIQIEEVQLTRKRLEKERDNAQIFAITKFAKQILEVQDNMQRALEINREKYQGKENDLFEGLTMTFHILQKTLEQNGVQKINPLKEKFNPNLHESLFEIEDPKQQPGTVAIVSQPGYVIGDRLLRAAKVGVFKRPQKPVEEKPAAAPADKANENQK